MKATQYDTYSHKVIKYKEIGINVMLSMRGKSPSSRSTSAKIYRTWTPTTKAVPSNQIMNCRNTRK
jgi:hypothetical protein